ncbi:serine/threonine-protein kinase 31-like [Sinocyclocheilus rhinocerous]|uniref:serine/threonine-protein kinase 31-like n=1 Tax=Sinocyclocheilus rhinocerous TaxID=307959 RepID=UPI0007B7D3C9|nr:PREDICTED: serine/threonine-protein kinase 31-like [Sinocyclocheilus rhinocerous]
MKGVSLGLQNLHAASLTHASLHPNNVFAIGREKGIVGDYDFTKTPEQRVSDSGMVAGSIRLVAPELKQGQLPSPASDMYAFGGIMLWLHVADFSRTLERERQNVEFSGLGLEEARQAEILSVMQQWLSLIGNQTTEPFDIAAICRDERLDDPRSFTTI